MGGFNYQDEDLTPTTPAAETAEEQVTTDSAPEALPMDELDSEATE